MDFTSPSDSAAHLETKGSQGKNETNRDNQLIGIDLGACVADIMARRVNLDQVLCIILANESGTEPQAFLATKILQYRGYSWYDNPDGGEALTRELQNGGKLTVVQSSVPKNNFNERWLKKGKINEFLEKRTEISADFRDKLLKLS